MTLDAVLAHHLHSKSTTSRPSSSYCMGSGADFGSLSLYIIILWRAGCSIYENLYPFSRNSHKAKKNPSCPPPTPPSSSPAPEEVCLSSLSQNKPNPLLPPHEPLPFPNTPLPRYRPRPHPALPPPPPHYRNRRRPRPNGPRLSITAHP